MSDRDFTPPGLQVWQPAGMTSLLTRPLVTVGTALAAVVVLLASVLGMPGSADAVAACGKKIAFLGALTGDAGGYGVAVANGAQLAVGQYNAAHPGCTVDLVKYDSQGDPSSAVPLATEIAATPEILGVVGPTFSGESIATGQIFADAGLPTVSPSATNPVVAQQGWKTFHRLVADDARVGALQARYAVKKLKKKRVAVVSDDSDYGRLVARAARAALGKKLVLKASVKQGQRSFGTLARKIKAKKVTAVIYGGYLYEAGPFAKKLGKVGYKGPFITGDGSMDAMYAKLAGTKAAARTHLLTGTAPPTLSTSFTKAYRAAFGSSPQNNSLEAYDAARILLSGIASGAATRSAEHAWVNGYRSQGLTKKIAFTARGELVTAPVWAYKPKGSGFAVRSTIS